MTPPLPSKILSFLLIGCMGLVSGFTYDYYERAVFTLPSSVTENRDRVAPKEISLDPNLLTARAAVLIDPVTNTILFSKEGETQLPLASLTKLATARAVLSSAQANTFVVISEEDLKEEGDSGLHVGDVWRLVDLVAFGLTTSSNDAMAAAASALSEGTAVSRMNYAARSEGLAQSYFLNPTGLDVSSSTAGAYGSALDVARLVEILLREYPTIFEATVRWPQTPAESGKGAVSTTEPIWGLPGLIAAKTGFTDLAGGNLAVAVDLGLGEPVIAVVLGSTRERRFDDIRLLVEEARKNLSL